MIEVLEKFDSRIVTTGTSPFAELHYAIVGTEDDSEARNALASESPAAYDLFGSGALFLPRESISAEPVAPNLWDGTVRYGSAPATNQSVFAFDTGGGSTHITHARRHVADYGTPVRNHQGAIGVTGDGQVEGIDITVPIYHFSETHYLPNFVVTPAYRGTLFRLTGRVNSGPFKGLDPGECLFLGASGTTRGSGDWEILFRFAASPNETDLRVGNIAGIEKFGWDYLWVEYQQQAEETYLVSVPIAVHIEQVYPYADLNSLGIG